ncbi:MAG: 2Fe-2S iron-sulfur cluster-binding protein [Bacteriovoracaceae bacterium]
MSTFKVTLWPSGEAFSVNEETTLLKALKDNNHYVKSSCGGVASCSDCVIKVHTGEANLTPATFGELKLLGNVFHITKERMSCQTRCTGDVTIDISRHNQTMDQMKTANKKFVKKPLLKKKADVEKQAVDRAVKREAKKDTDSKWHKHWEKGEENDPSKAKIQGGGKRPRAFKYDLEADATDTSETDE